MCRCAKSVSPTVRDQWLGLMREGGLDLAQP